MRTSVSTLALEPFSNMPTVLMLSRVAKWKRGAIDPSERLLQEAQKSGARAYPENGSRTDTPVRAISATLRVTSVKP